MCHNSFKKAIRWSVTEVFQTLISSLTLKFNVTNRMPGVQNNIFLLD